MHDVDEPSFGLEHNGPTDDAVDPRDVAAGIRDLLAQQRFAVLCTQGGEQPYGSLIAYAVDDGLETAVFSTARATRKYNLLKACSRVALVVDSRPSYPDDLMKVEAITATGRVRELEDKERGPWAAMLIARHPQLRAFVTSPSTAVFKVEMVRYLYVTRFQEVHQWVPGPSRNARCS